MRLINHTNNNPRWHAKQGEATAEQVAAFAKEYQKADAWAWAVVVTETADSVWGDHIDHVVDNTKSDSSLVVWVSDGNFAQVVWRKSE